MSLASCIEGDRIPYLKTIFNQTRFLENNLLLNCSFDSKLLSSLSSCFPSCTVIRMEIFLCFSQAKTYAFIHPFFHLKMHSRFMFYRPLRPLMWRFAIQSARHDKRACGSLSLFSLCSPSCELSITSFLDIPDWWASFIFCVLPEAVLLVSASAKRHPTFSRITSESC